jgi:hypothetical protein
LVSGEGCGAEGGRREATRKKEERTHLERGQAEDDLAELVLLLDDDELAADARAERLEGLLVLVVVGL